MATKKTKFGSGGLTFGQNAPMRTPSRAVAKNVMVSTSSRRPINSLSMRPTRRDMDYLRGRSDVSGSTALPKQLAGARKGGSMSSWEGSPKDEREDKKLAKKRGMSMAEWERSAADKKHDRQHSAAGLKKGGTMKKRDSADKGGKMMKMAKGGSTSARADGIASKGKTKTAYPTMRGGGKCK